jgi:sugar lactone lactonase YvrE
MRRTLWALVSGLLALTMLLVAAPTARADEKDKDEERYPRVISLPNGWQPEGIVAGEGTTLYAGSLATGSIYAADVKTGEGEVVVSVTGRVSVGLSYDKRSGYLFAAGGPQGKLWVYDPESGATVGEYTLGQGFINDVIVTREAAYVTNSAQPVFYKVPLGKGGELPAQGDVQTIPLSGEWQQVPGFNANGIEAAQNGKYLIIVNSTVGKLYRVDAKTGVAKAIDLGGYSVAQGDGLLLEGRTLYVLRNRIETVAVIKLGGSLLQGRLVKEIIAPEPADLLDVPTTIASVKGELYVVNARFGNPAPTTASYTIVRLTGDDDDKDDKGKDD